MNFFAELRRRNVIRMAGLYLVGAWLIVQVAETLLPIFDTPHWVLKVLVVLLALGFLPALIFSWVFELTPGGLKRDAEVPPGQSIAPQTARRMDRMIIVVLALALVYFTVDKFVLSPRAAKSSVAEAAPGRANATPNKPADSKAIAADPKTIAVLPFADFSPGGDQQWFADGLSEEILNALTRTPDLEVAARTSSFRYKGSTLAIPQIAAELGVAHVLEGSVRSTPQRVRVTAQLIRAADGFHVWSQNYDRDPSDVISIQEDLARQIATAMQTSMDPAALADMAQVGTRSVEAYQAYLRGIAGSLDLSDPKAFSAAYQQFETSRALDPTFAAAHARAAYYWRTQLDPTLTTYEPVDVTPDAMRERFRERIDLAIQHASRDVDRHASLALKALHDLRLREAIDLQHQVLAERPNDRDALSDLLSLYTRTSEPVLMREPLDKVWSLAFGRQDWANLYLNYAHRGPDRRRAAERALELAERWRDDEGVLYQAHRALLWDGRVEAARTVFERWKQQTNQSHWSSIPPARQASAEGRCEEVAHMLANLPPGDISQRWHLLMLLDRRDEANQLLMAFEQSGNTQALAGFLSYRHFDPSPFPSLMRVLERERIQRPPPEPLPFACKPSGVNS